MVKPVRDCDQSLPPANDERWAGWAKPLIDFLIYPRNWKELKAYSKENKLSQDGIRNLLAWLNLHNIATCVHVKIGSQDSYVWFLLNNGLPEGYEEIPPEIETKVKIVETIIETEEDLNG